jgi:hypothetical protein
VSDALTSLRPSPEMARTSLITLILLLSSKDKSLMSNESFSTGFSSSCEHHRSHQTRPLPGF